MSISYDFIGRCLDAAIPLAAGVIGLIYYPRRIQRDVESGSLTDGQAQAKLHKVKTLCYFAIVFALYLMVRAFTG
jgi:hypothetical protein